MPTHIISSWPLLCFIFGGVLFLTVIMNRQSAHFYTKDVVLRKFSIMDLQIPSTPAELVNLIKGLYQLPPADSAITVKALRGQLYIDFIFMPFAYGAIAILCVQLSMKMSTPFGKNIFIIFAYLQLIAWLCDIIENIYLLQKIKPGVEPSSPALHKAYLVMECFKWGIALIGLNCAIAATFYFWLTGKYTASSLHYLIIIIAEIAVFLVVSKMLFKKKPVTG